MKKKKYALIVSNYPSIEEPNAFGFVHSRVRAYNQLGINVDVYKISTIQKEYDYENITVQCGNKNQIKSMIDNTKYEKLLVHFLDKDKIEIIGNNQCIIWVHGFEALSWKRRLFNLNLRLPLYILENENQLRNFRDFAMSNPNAKFIFVSNWMYEITCKDIGYTIKNYEIIHNFIDNNIFKYKQKNNPDKNKILMIRSFESKKYANDISIKFILELSKKIYFNDLKFTIYGKGRHFTKLTNKLSNFSNVEVYNKFISQKEVADLHDNHGVYLCPTRQDSQGVSMGEAMSSGLVPLTSFNTAIPEFVEPNRDGMLCDNNNIQSFVDAFEKIYFEENMFKKMSKNASNRMHTQCSFDNTVLKEIEEIKQ